MTVGHTIGRQVCFHIYTVESQKFWSLVFMISTFCHYSFDLLWMVLTNKHETTWLVSPLPPLSCCCTNRHLSQVLSFIKWGWLLLCFLTPEHKYCFVLLRSSFMLFYSLCSFVFLLLVFHNFFEPNKHFTFKMYFDIYHGFISLNHKHWMSTVH